LKNWRVLFVKDVANIIAKLPPERKQLVRASIDELRKDPYLGKPLIEDLAGYWTYKAGRYRIIYRIPRDRSVIEVHYLGHRGGVYETFQALMRSLQAREEET